MAEDAEEMAEETGETAEETAAPPAGGMNSKTKLYLALALLGLVGFAYFSYQKGNAQPLILVNGLDIPYTVAIGEKTIELPPHSHKKATVPEGRVKVEPVDGNLEIDTTELEIDTFFWTRPFNDTVWVVNPDQTGILVWEEMTYAEQKSQRDYRYRLQVGKKQYTFDVDYLFSPFPETVKTESSTSKRQRLSVLGASTLESAWILQEETDGKTAIAFLKRHLRYTPENTQLLFLLRRLAGDDAFFAFLKEGLSARPVRTEWHRNYQFLALDRGTAPEKLIEEYKAFVEAEPDNPELHYLYGRVLVDPDRAMAQFKKSTELEPPSAHGFHAMAYGKVAVGEFVDAHQLVKQARKERPGDPNFLQTERWALRGLGKWEQVAASLRTQETNYPLDPGPVAERMYPILKSDGPGAIPMAIQAYLKRVRKPENAEQLDPESLKANVAWLQAEAAYVLGQRERFNKAVEGRDWPLMQLAATVWNEDIDAAWSIFQKSRGSLSDVDVAAFVIAALEAERPGLAEKGLEALLPRLRRRQPEYRVAADILEETGNWKPADFCRFSLPVRDKAILLTLIGQKFPEARKACFSLAKKLNLHGRFPHHLLKKVHQ